MLIRGNGFAQGVDRAGLQRARRTAKDLVQQVQAVAGGRSAPRATLAAPRTPRNFQRPPGHRSSRSLTPIAWLAAGPGTDGARYTLANGRGAHFADVQNLAKQEFIVAVDLDDRERDARILLAAPLIAVTNSKSTFRTVSNAANPLSGIRGNKRCLHAASCASTPSHSKRSPCRMCRPDAARTAMLQGVRELGIDALPWTRDARDLQARMEFVRRLEDGRQSPADPMPVSTSDWPSVSDAALADNIDVWLAPWLDGITRRDHLTRLSLPDILRALLPWDKQRQLDDLAPTHLQVPSGSNIRIDYLDESAPAVSVRLQEVFGLDATPRIGGGKTPITFKLLSPAHRPVQVTRDLASFWRGSYADVRKDMRGRYPKHYWPENPLEAQATRGVRRRT